jgi:hypothetical protein
VTGKRIVVSDRMQKRYAYTRPAPMGKRFSPEFKPDLTPKQMLRLGVFGGKYMNDCKKEFPKDWFAAAKLSTAKNAALNFFKVNASQPLSAWIKNGWIHPQDPRLVPMVLSLLRGPPHVGRRAANRPVEGDPAPRRPDQKKLRAGRNQLPAAPAPGASSLGV